MGENRSRASMNELPAPPKDPGTSGQQNPRGSRLPQVTQTSVTTNSKLETAAKSQRNPSPLLLSNFFTPVLNQFPATKRTNHKLSVAQGKMPMAVSESTDFPSLPPKTQSQKSPLPTVSAPPPCPNPTSSGEGPREAPLPQSRSYRDVVSAQTDKDPGTAATRGPEHLDLSFSSVKQNSLSVHQGEPA